MSFLSLAVSFGLAGIASAQGSFNFQKVDIQEGYNPTSINNSGAMLGDFYGTTEMWTQQYGLTQVTKQSGDSYLSTISESGRVYGSSNGSIIRFDPYGGRQTIVTNANTQFSIVATNDQDNLLLRGVSAAGTSYYVYGLGGLQQITIPTSSNFTPTQIMRDGSVFGTVPGGTNEVGTPGVNIVRWNGDGTISAVAHSALNFSSYGYSKSQSFDYLPSGYSVVKTLVSTSDTSSSSQGFSYDVYAPDGSKYEATADYYSSHIGGFQSGFAPKVFLNDGTMIGSTLYPYQAKTIYSFSHPEGVEMDSSFFATGSSIPDSILCGASNGRMVGTAMVDGHQEYYMTNFGTVPEPASLAALGLGALALLRRRRK
ncbi:MAG: PEP-CTERM sorting domain-containing protein [Armatimonadetes bacterium]|nr:PEP-CTERM sorting domain-containing protein [Armatimonadota bacterium]